jgi:hypothetical protein
MPCFESYTSHVNWNDEKLTFRFSLLDLLRRPSQTPLLPLQNRLLLRPRLPEIRLEDAPQCLRTRTANRQRARYTQLLQPYEPHVRVLSKTHLAVLQDEKTLMKKL